MRIAVIGSRGIPASFGGIERHVEELYARLAAMGCEVDVYCRRQYVEAVQDKIQWEKPLRIGHYRNCRLIVSSTPSIKGLEAFVHSFRATLQALNEDSYTPLELWQRIIVHADLRCGYDLYHYHALGPTLFSALPMLLGKRVVATCHGLDWQRDKWKGVARKFLQFCERFMGKRVKNLICVSEDLKEHFESAYQRKAVYIPNGAEVPPPIPPTDFPEFRLESGKYVVFFGRLTPEKEIHTLIKAFQRTAGDCKLAIVGGSSHTDDYVNALKEVAVEDPETARRLVFTGYAYGEQLDALIANSRFVINPSRLEGLPIVVLEAYARGKHVLASDIPPHRQVVKEEGWLFPTGNVEALAATIDQHLEDNLPHRDPSLIARIESEYNWNRIAEQTLAYFRGLVE